MGSIERTSSFAFHRAGGDWYVKDGGILTSLDGESRVVKQLEEMYKAMADDP